MAATSRGLIVRPPWLGRIVLHGKKQNAIEDAWYNQH